MKPSNSSPATSPGVSPVVVGTSFCMVAALGYTAVNVCLRAIPHHYDMAWVTCVKELVTVAVVGPFLLYQGVRGLRVWPGAKAVWVLLGAALAVQLGGNIGCLWALRQIGLAVTMPIVMGGNLAGSAVLARVLLGERVSMRSVLAIVVLVVSIVILTWGAETAEEVIHSETSPVALASVPGAAIPVALPKVSPSAIWAVLAACGVGLTYALLGISIRGTVTNDTKPSTILFIVTGVGVVSLGAISFLRLGAEGILTTRPADLGIMIAAGALNLIAFFSITKGFQLTTVLRANILNASQTALAAVGGILLFREPVTASLVVGVSLTIVGMVLIDPA